jgi:DeoR family L-fucose operon activator
MALKKEDRRQNILSILAERESVNTQELATPGCFSGYAQEGLEGSAEIGSCDQWVWSSKAVNQETDPSSFS